MKILVKHQFGPKQTQIPMYVRLLNPNVLQDFCRGVAVNTSYLSDIQVRQYVNRLPLETF